MKISKEITLVSIAKLTLSFVWFVFRLILYTAIFYFIGGFTPVQSFLLGIVVFEIIQGYMRDIKRRGLQKIELTISPFWENLFKHPNYPEKQRKKMLEIFKEINQEKMKRSHLFNEILRFVLDSNGSSAWSDYHKTILTASNPLAIYPEYFPKTLFLLGEKISRDLLSESESKGEPKLRICEREGEFQFIFLIEKPHPLRYEEKEICSFPSFLVYEKPNWSSEVVLKACGFKKIDNDWDEFEFKNNYFHINVRIIQ